jgi:cytochrome P450
VIGWRRRATEDVDVAGTLIPKDSVVLMLLFSANHDPRRFEGAQAFDIRREDARSHLTFGKGTHFCSGAPMARMEMRIVLENLIEKAPGMRLVEDQVLDFLPNISQRGPRGLLVDFAPDRTRVLT